DAVLVGVHERHARDVTLWRARGDERGAQAGGQEEREQRPSQHADPHTHIARSQITPPSSRIERSTARAVPGNPDAMTSVPSRSARKPCSAQLASKSMPM